MNTMTPERKYSVIIFALHEFERNARDRADAAAQDINGKWFKDGATEAFLKDANDADIILRELKQKQYEAKNV